MKKKVGRYSGYIRPLSYIIDLITINAMALVLLPSDFTTIGYLFFISICWVSITWNIDFYEVYRYTKPLKIIGKLIKQFIAFFILNLAYIGYLSKEIAPKELFIYSLASIIAVGIFKFSIFFSLRRFRSEFKGNLRRVVVLGHGRETAELIDFFRNNPDYGYELEYIFDLKNEKEQQLQQCYDFVLTNKIDEIYCSLSCVNNDEVKNLIDFTDNNLKILKFLPNLHITPQLRNMAYDYYDYIPILSIRNVPLNKNVNKAIKRLFDIVFSLAVIVFILSWLTPILAILIKLDSKGSVFFKQKRNGLNYKEFYCYKFRSMRPNELADVSQVTKNDPRITRVGAFLRKTSIDELPQFWNVLIGDMSVVGPRPHMIKETQRFAQKVDKFMVRHFIKPGITGLAQTNGYRGEIETDNDIIHRVKYDIFYLENWTFLLDIKIILNTIFNALKGENKAY